MFKSSKFGIPNKAMPFTGATKNVNVSCLLMCLICTFHTPSREILVLLHVLNIIFMSLVLYHWSVIVLGNKFGKCWIAFNYQHCLYLSCMIFCIFYVFLLFSRFVIINDLMLLKLSKFIITTSIFLSSSVWCYACLPPHPALFHVLLCLSCSHLHVCFAFAQFCTLHRGDSVSHILCIYCYMLGTALVDGSLHNTLSLSLPSVGFALCTASDFFCLLYFVTLLSVTSKLPPFDP